ncbi:MAG: Triosephosphate isomerase, partial [uncultured Thermomicrobiales bacterium]
GVAVDRWQLEDEPRLAGRVGPGRCRRRRSGHGRADGRLSAVPVARAGPGRARRVAGCPRSAKLRQRAARRPHRRGLGADAGRTVPLRHRRSFGTAGDLRRDGPDNRPQNASGAGGGADPNRLRRRESGSTPARRCRRRRPRAPGWIAERDRTGRNRTMHRRLRAGLGDRHRGRRDRRRCRCDGRGDPRMAGFHTPGRRKHAADPVRRQRHGDQRGGAARAGGHRRRVGRRRQSRRGRLHRHRRGGAPL